MQTLHHKQKLIVQGCRMTVGTSAGYCPDMPANGPIVWTTKAPTVLSASQEYCRNQERIWADADTVEDGEMVNFTDTEGWFTVKIVGLQYSDPIHFIEAEAPHTLLQVWTPDTVAECLSVGDSLYLKIWNEIVPLTEGLAPPHPGEVPEHTLSAYWDKFTWKEREQLNEAAMRTDSQGS